ncbi:ATP-binding cassette domain-containing protein [Streptomyces sp. ISL-86]|uniref:ATP-binding cassette domain-containing protein n=1 Tax=Streptomyces sp. ISL-86 TaxID=2819187 RepID=UPI0035A8224D
MGRRYGMRRPWVLRGVSLELPRGTLVRVEGRNGGGKFTLLRLVAGIDTPTEGRISGRPRRTAYVPERFPAALPLTAAAYLTHMGRVHGLARTEAAHRAAAWLERFGAAGHAGTPLAELSKGTSQKVAVAQALLAEPGLLVLDEAWTGLDLPARAELDRPGPWRCWCARWPAWPWGRCAAGRWSTRPGTRSRRRASAACSPWSPRAPRPGWW